MFTYGSLLAPPRALSRQRFSSMKFAYCRLWEAHVKTHKYCTVQYLYNQGCGHIVIEVNPDPDQDRAVFLNPDTDPYPQSLNQDPIRIWIRIRIQKRSFEEKIIKKAILFFIFLPLDPDQGFRIQIPNWDPDPQIH
jgi:hypothetical protein